jgi:hypothetical protein
MKIQPNNIIYATLLAICMLPITGCNKYLNDTKLPANTISAQGVYATDASTSSVIAGYYISLNAAGAPFSGSASGNMGYTLGLYTDELTNLNPGNFGDTYYKDAISISAAGYWSNLYARIYTINSAIEGINSSTATLNYKNQWLGESYFVRALLYYYLVGYYGDVPLALTTDYTVNNTLSRTPQAQVYQQIISDLKQAQALLPVNYTDGSGVATTARIRPDQAAATALLARIYLYAQDWADAETQATAVINNSAYQMSALSQTFLSGSQETIWALAPTSGLSVCEYAFYNNGMPAVLPAGETPATFYDYAGISSFLMNAFEPNDGRFTNWIRASTVPATATVAAQTYYFPNKYKSATGGAENEVILRLSEQYLIRAEARAQQNESTAAADINVVRARAGLPATSATTKATLLAAIAKERQTELFTECGQRFFDLKRTGKIDSVMNIVAPVKGTAWQSYMSLWPIPPADIIQDPHLTPNPGY